jgi:hypothetical protein
VSCAYGAVDCGTCKKASQHGTKVVLHTAARVVVRGDGKLPKTDMHPWLEGRAPQEVWRFGAHQRPKGPRR